MKNTIHSPKPKDIQFTVICAKEKLIIFSSEKLKKEDVAIFAWKITDTINRLWK